ncbi:Smp-30/Cgr1 family protein (plasmid) [Tistrella mobilis KA081020-065]|uniref:Smp-30/Cgr1 family protein n=2 Tax=Tistrella mobilis TaxID=171437 RepID=I3TSB5_TISMK|nr:Smp-30/Cgr1 family protein [Tistrella mobilis KA081020-065]
MPDDGVSIMTAPSQDARIYDARICRLGEGPLWHPRRGQLFWFDILDRRLLSRSPAGDGLSWLFPDMVSAAGWVDDDRLLIASERALFVFDLQTSTRTDLAALEADNPLTRSNDGRADPWGGFWIGTMAKTGAPGHGSIYRWYRGRLARLRGGIGIPNAICFAPDRSVACYADTREGIIWRQPLDAEGWPRGAPEVFLDLRPDGIHPDGAVIDAEGCLWNARWGTGQVVRYSPAGDVIATITLPVAQTTCPAFGGPDFRSLYVTSAADGDPSPDAGLTWLAAETAVPGLPEPRVILTEDVC